MPKGRRAKERKTTAEGAPARKSNQSVQKFVRPPDPLTRPRTRAWVKQEKESERRETARRATTAARRLSSRQQGLQPEEPNGQLSALQRDQPQASIEATSRSQRIRRPLITKAPPAKPHAKRKKGLGRQTGAEEERNAQQTGETGQIQDPAFANWLNRVESVSPEGLHQAEVFYTPPGSQIEDRLEDTMDSSSISREDGSTTTKGKRPGRIKVSIEKLRVRRVMKEARKDSRLQHLNSILTTELPERPLKDIEELRSLATKFLRQIVEHPNDNCYSYLDEFSFDFDKGKSKINYPIVNHRYFEADLKRCLGSNEAVLQRTVMIHIIDQYWLKDIFDWNTEGQWSQPKQMRLPSREDDEISLPKPDLAISFKLTSFTVAEDESDPIPPDLAHCLSPDGGNRCFPFLFFEAKKAGADLQDAYTANLHSASQALYNMYRWMERSDNEELFLKEVRVFSVVFNAQDLGIRVHRAARVSDSRGSLCFQFDEFRPLDRYTKDQACLLIKAIVNDYAAKELHPILKSAFAQIVTQEDERIAIKRKTATTGNSSSKRTRRSEDDIVHTGQSFGMSNLNP